MSSIDVPEGMKGRPAADLANEIAAGPFVVEHSTRSFLAAHLQDFGDGVLQFWSNGAAFPVGADFKVTRRGDTLELFSEERNWLVILRPLELEDAEWAMSEDYNPRSLEQFMLDALEDVDATM